MLLLPSVSSKSAPSASGGSCETCWLAQDCFELGVILLRKKLYTQATKNLEKASRMWDGEPEELAQACVCFMSLRGASFMLQGRLRCLSHI